MKRTDNRSGRFLTFPVIKKKQQLRIPAMLHKPLALAGNGRQSAGLRIDRGCEGRSKQSAHQRAYPAVLICFVSGWLLVVITRCKEISLSQVLISVHRAE